jgi:hypothetical protein
MTFKDEKWEQREQTLGDPAEQAFENWSNHYSLPFERYGLLRPNVAMVRLPVEIRYTPDYVTEYGFVEVQGCGMDGLVKFKHDKLEALKWWDRIYPVTFWLWSQSSGLDAQCGLMEVMDRCVDEMYADYRTDGLFDGNKPYSNVRFVDLM